MGMAAASQEGLGGAITTGVKRAVNGAIRQNLAAAEPEPIAFFCECVDSDCFLPVWLNVADYDAGRADPHWHALRPRHVVSRPPLKAA
jgi:hypothetical protein